MNRRKRIVIVGGGFGGIKVAIECAKNNLGEIVLISDESRFAHHAALYAIATGHNIKESSVSIRDIFWFYPNIKFIKDKISEVDSKNKVLIGKKRYRYDQAIFALGLIDSFMVSEIADKPANPMMTLESARDFQGKLHKLLASSHQKQAKIVVVGAGMTGVELAGAISECVRKIIDSHQLTGKKAEVYLIEKSSTILPSLTKRMSLALSRELRKMGVKVVTKSKVNLTHKKSLVVSGKRMQADLIAWTCGGKNNPFFAQNSKIFKLSAQGLVIVNHYLEAYPDIFVIGDSTNSEDLKNAAAAINQAKFVARHIRKVQKSCTLRPYRPRRYPVSVSLARTWAYFGYKNIMINGLLGAIIRRWLEFNNYRQLLPLKYAYKFWRRHKNINQSCCLCKK